MSLGELLLTILALGIIIGGILLLKKSATKFNLSPDQLDRIKKRNNDLDKKDKDD